MRNTGIEAVGGAPWGTHFCQFYETKQDLVDVLVPYFKAGLEDNECCMWITAEPLKEAEALQTLRAAIPDADHYVQNGQLEILSHSEWYLRDGAFDSQRVMQGWAERLEWAVARGYDGLRLTGNTFWLEKEDWRDFSEYEHEVDRVISHHRMLALCTYSLDRCGPHEIIDVIKNHQFALIKRQSRWEIIESSDRKRAQEALKQSEERLRLFIENSPDIFFLQDRDLRYIWSVRPGPPFTAEEVVGKTEYDLRSPEEAERLVQIKRKVLETGVEIRYELQLNVGGETRWYDAYYKPWRDAEGNITGVAGYSRDITERKQAEAERERLLFELEAANEELKCEIRQREEAEEAREALLVRLKEINQELAIANRYAQEREQETRQRLAELRQLEEQREEFIRTISHDLRNPLTGLLGHAQVLRYLLRPRAGMEREMNSVEAIITAGKRMNSMIQDLVDSVRIESGRIELHQRPLSLQHLVSDLLERTGTPEDRARLRLDLDQSVPAVLADPERLERAIANLLTNALKYSPAGRPVMVRVSQDGGQAIISVADEGPGIDPEEQPHLFDRYYRGKMGQESEGQGLGLYIARLIVEAHGDRVWLESEKGKGSTFYLGLPMASS